MFKPNHLSVSVLDHYDSNYKSNPSNRHRAIVPLHILHILENAVMDSVEGVGIEKLTSEDLTIR